MSAYGLQRDSFQFDFDAFAGCAFCDGFKGKIQHFFINRIKLAATDLGADGFGIGQFGGLLRDGGKQDFGRSSFHASANPRKFAAVGHLNDAAAADAGQKFDCRHILHFDNTADERAFLPSG